MSAFFSVIIPLYNKEKDIAKTLKSVINQDFKDFEIIIVNDGSTDNSVKVVESFDDNRITLYHIENSGASVARNTGVEMSSANYIAFIDADDYWYENHLSCLFDIIKKYPTCRWYANAYEIQHNERLTVTMRSPVMNHDEDWNGQVEDYFANCLTDSVVWTSTACFQKSFFNELEGFNPEFQTGQDTDLWIRAALLSNVAFNSKVTARYCLQGSNRLTNVPTLLKRYMDPDAFRSQELNNPKLKKYLDQIRYSFSLKHKIAGDIQLSTYYKHHIDIANLSLIKRFLLLQRPTVLNQLHRVKMFLEKIGIRIRTSY